MIKHEQVETEKTHPLMSNIFDFKETTCRFSYRIHVEFTKTDC